MSVVAGPVRLFLHHAQHAVVWWSFVRWAEDHVCSAEVRGRVECRVHAECLGGSHEADEHAEEAAPDVDQFASSPSVHFAPPFDVLDRHWESVTWYRREHVGQSSQCSRELVRLLWWAEGLA